MFREIKTREKNLNSNPNSNYRCSFNPDKVSDMKFDFSKALANHTSIDKTSEMKFNFEVAKSN